MWWRRVRWLLTLIALCSIATCPSAKRSCQAKQEAREAPDLVSVIADRVSLAVASTGKVPPLPAGPTPVPSCCEQGGTCAADPTIWQAPGWRALQFSVDGAFRYTYQYLPDPSGLAATVRATGDLDCDGVQAIYELQLTAQGPLVMRRWHRVNPYE
jgi:hypothetical protein